MINLLYVLAPAICTNCVPVGSWVLALVWVLVPALFINYTMMSCVMLKLDVMNVLCLSTMLRFHNCHHNNPLHHCSNLRPTTTPIQCMHQPTDMEIYRGGNDGSQNECSLRLALSVYNPNRWEVDLFNGAGQFHHDGDYVGSFTIPPGQNFRHRWLVILWWRWCWLLALSLTLEYYQGTLKFIVGGHSQVKIWFGL
jgi:hypothetical protein